MSKADSAAQAIAATVGVSALIVAIALGGFLWAVVQFTMLTLFVIGVGS